MMYFGWISFHFSLFIIHSVSLMYSLSLAKSENHSGIICLKLFQSFRFLLFFQDFNDINVPESIVVFSVIQNSIKLSSSFLILFLFLSFCCLTYIFSFISFQ